MEIEMRPMSFIRKHQHLVLMCHPCDFRKVRADTIIGWIVHQDGLGIRMTANGILYLFYPHAK